jgi:CRISPR-associated protein Cmx8
MAKAPTHLDSVSVFYELLGLPTAQHKAGLAGLVAQIHDMEARHLSAPVIEELGPLAARVRFTAESTQALLDDLYAADWVEVAATQRWPGTPPLREEAHEERDEATGKTRTTRRFIYRVVQPRGTFLRERFPDGDGLWLKLWRNMLWDLPRSRPTTRLPFHQRAEGQPCAEGRAAWADLQAAERCRRRNAVHTGEVAGALLLGAQAQSAERVPFLGRGEENLLLHFWPLTVLTFVPQQFTADGDSEFVGYLLAIPEVSDLTEFERLYGRLLRQLPAGARGYRPVGAVIDLPAQGALEFLAHLDRLAQELAAGQDIAYAVSAVEFLHADRRGNNVKTLAGGRVAPRPGLLGAYRALLRECRNPLFRSARILALLRGRPWYEGLGELFAERPWHFFVRGEQTPRTMPWFGLDAARAFERIDEEHQHDLEAHAMTTTTGTDPGTAAERPRTPLEAIVFRLIRTYVQRKTEDRCGIRWEDFKDKKVKDEKSGRERVAVPAEYLEAKQKVASDAFLALRSRREQDFVDYFTATVCQVAQFLPEDDYRVLAEALIGPATNDRWEDVKTLSLLALSASS